ncbi:ATP-binding protein [Streptomyces sp. NPDC056704]|uniref:ATP-binding protein n=1 Tax=Streptomyces sp. NPDC056704 TaxID=3345917 RepID=UPI00368DCF24
MSHEVSRHRQTENRVTGGTFYSTVIQGHNITLAMPTAAPLARSGLPPVTLAFTGRNGETSAILDALAQSTSVLITGLAGIGKTELALHAAQQASQHGLFRGGVLFIDLFGYDERRQVSPERALDGLLRSLGIPAEHIPPDLQSRKRLYRSIFFALGEQGHRVLVIIDNASTADQVKDLLPPSSAGTALITSRNALGGFDAQLLDLDVLSTAGSIELIRRAISGARGQADSRVNEDQISAIEVSELCGNLPLALRVAASLLADQPMRTLASLAEELRDARTRLDELVREDVSVRTALELSYRRLSEEHGQLLRLASLNPGPDFSVELVSRLAQKPQPQVRRGLEALGRAHLIEPSRAYGRWRMHDLVRLYAEDQSWENAKKDGRSAALGRLVTFFRQLTMQAISVTDPEVCTVENGRFSSVRDALDWLNMEHENVTSATLLALRYGDSQGIVLSSALAPHLARLRRLEDLEYVARHAATLAMQGDFPWEMQFQAFNTFGNALAAVGLDREAIKVLGAAAKIAHQSSRSQEEVLALRGLGASQINMKRWHEAVQTFNSVIQISRRMGDRNSEAVGLDYLAIALRHIGQPERGIEFHKVAIAIFRECGALGNLATALGALGMTYESVGATEESIHALRESTRLFRESGSDHSSMKAMANLGFVYRKTGRHKEAISLTREAASFFRAHEDLNNEAIALHNLAHSLCQEGEFEQAVEVFQRGAHVARAQKDFHNENIHLVNLGNVVRVLGRVDEAIAARRESIASLPNDVDPRDAVVALINLAQLLLGENQKVEGKSLVEKATASIAALYRETGTPFRLEGLAMDGSGRVSSLVIGASDQEKDDLKSGGGESPA